jgi:hypothetical protein
MKQLAILALALTPILGVAADLTINDGKAYVVGLDQQELVLDSLRIGDNASIRFAPGVGSWRVQAAHAYIGSNVVVDGRGLAGTVGADGQPGQDCEATLDGAEGEEGVAGSDGVEIRFQLGLESLGWMQVLSAAGDGGAGGAGGDGAGLRAGCGLDTAGEGGNGGNGGEGGRGGDITFLYQALSNTESGDAMAARIEINAEGGNGGNGGDAGSGGLGSSGRYVSQKTLVGNRKWVVGSQGGLAGSPGASASAGNPGRILIDQLILSAAKPAVTAGSDFSIKALQTQLRQLAKRVEALEAAKANTP